MAKITETKPNIRQWQFKQEKSDSDYGTCLWATFTLDCGNYTLMIDSDCGDYTYSWTPTPNIESFVHLMSRINGDYLLNKISSQSLFNYIQSVAETCSNLIEYCELEKGEDADFDKLIEDINDLDDYKTSPALFYRECERLIDDYDYYGIDTFGIISTVHDYPAVAKRIVKIFTEHLQPLLCKEKTPESE